LSENNLKKSRFLVAEPKRFGIVSTSAGNEARPNDTRP
jgi:hypothetical protein